MSATLYACMTCGGHRTSLVNGECESCAKHVAPLRARLREVEAVSAARLQWLNRMAEAVGYPADADTADVLGKIDDLREVEAERDGAVARERAKVVAWLRGHRHCGLAQSYADAIERGEHDDG